MEIYSNWLLRSQEYINWEGRHRHLRLKPSKIHQLLRNFPNCAKVMTLPEQHSIPNDHINSNWYLYSICPFSLRNHFFFLLLKSLHIAKTNCSLNVPFIRRRRGGPGIEWVVSNVCKRLIDIQLLSSPPRLDCGANDQILSNRHWNATKVDLIARVNNNRIATVFN